MTIWRRAVHGHAARNAPPDRHGVDYGDPEKKPAGLITRPVSRLRRNEPPRKMSLAFAAEDQLAGMLHYLGRRILDRRFDDSLNLGTRLTEISRSLRFFRSARIPESHSSCHRRRAVSRRYSWSTPGGRARPRPKQTGDTHEATGFLVHVAVTSSLIIGTDLGRSGSRKIPIWATGSGKRLITLEPMRHLGRPGQPVEGRHLGFALFHREDRLGRPLVARHHLDVITEQAADQHRVDITRTNSCHWCCR